MPIGIDNRLFERIDGELAVRYSPHGSDGEFCTTSKNISGGGVRISLLKRLEPGSMLDLEIFRHGSDVSARCRGRVVWVWDEPLNTKAQQCFEAGIEFIDRHLLYIGRLINYLENKKSLI